MWCGWRIVANILTTQFQIVQNHWNGMSYIKNTANNINTHKILRYTIQFSSWKQWGETLKHGRFINISSKIWSFLRKGEIRGPIFQNSSEYQLLAHVKLQIIIHQYLFEYLSKVQTYIPRYLWPAVWSSISEYSIQTTYTGTSISVVQSKNAVCTKIKHNRYFHYTSNFRSIHSHPW